ncbi:MAG: hypothetical protein ACYTG0_14765 [Planctomycetota bacterium]|jgi:hypothetical protein
MESAETPIEIELALALVDLDRCSTADIQARFAERFDSETSLLLAHTSSLHDRLALALRQIPVDLALRLACDFAQHALSSTSQNRQYDWQQSEGKRNDECLAELRQHIDSGNRDPETVIRIKSCVSYLPWPCPGLYHIASAAVDTENAAKHVYQVARMARRYYSYRHEDACRDAKQEELLWQIRRFVRLLMDTVSNLATDIESEAD